MPALSYIVTNVGVHYCDSDIAAECVLHPFNASTTIVSKSSEKGKERILLGYSDAPVKIIFLSKPLPTL